MFRYKLRTLLIVLALGPPLIWGAWVFWPPPKPEPLPQPINVPLSELEWKEWARRRAEQQKIERNRP